MTDILSKISKQIQQAQRGADLTMRQRALGLAQLAMEASGNANTPTYQDMEEIAARYRASMDKQGVAGAIGGMAADPVTWATAPFLPAKGLAGALQVGGVAGALSGATTPVAQGESRLKNTYVQGGTGAALGGGLYGAGKVATSPLIKKLAADEFGGVGGDLPMDIASRMARAKEMGYNTPVYHGTNVKFNAFDSSKIGAHATGEGYGHYLATDKIVASGYSKDGEKGVMDLLYKSQKPLDSKAPTFNQAQTESILKQLLESEKTKYTDEVSSYKDSYLSNLVDTYSMDENRAIKEAAKILREGNRDAVNQIAEISNLFGDKEMVVRSVYNATGHDGIKVKNFGEGGDVYVAWFPENIRSVHAKFDPAKASSADLLAMRAPLTAGLGGTAAYNAQDGGKK
jgi:hypothetical protein